MTIKEMLEEAKKLAPIELREIMYAYGEETSSGGYYDIVLKVLDGPVCTGAGDTAERALLDFRRELTKLHVTTFFQKESRQ
jgi:hypothetical protein